MLHRTKASLEESRRIGIYDMGKVGAERAVFIWGMQPKVTIERGVWSRGVVVEGSKDARTHAPRVLCIRYAAYRKLAHRICSESLVEAE